MEVLNSLDNRELYERLERSGLADKLDHDPAWRLVKEAADRIVEAAIKEIVNTPPNEMVRIAELQQVIKKYKYALFSEIEMLKQEGELAFNELKERGETIQVT